MPCLPSCLGRSVAEGKVSKEAAGNDPAEEGREGRTITSSVERHKVHILYNIIFHSDSQYVSKYSAM